MSEGRWLVEMRGIVKRFDGVEALAGVDFAVGYQEVVGLLGDNGAGKSTLIKILTGVYPPDAGEIYFEGRPVRFRSPREARALGIETVYQDLALVEMMSIARNFFLGREPVQRVGPFSFLNMREMEAVTRRVLEEIGIRVRSVWEPVSVLSGGERQSIAIGRALHFGVRLLILDEPTSALSIKETRKVLGYVEEVRRRGLSVIFITHNIYHVYPVADRLVILSHGRKIGDFRKTDISPEMVAELIAGGITLPEEGKP
ncbi:ATP-binding cassette domain-containing protein [Thermoflexus sp.]|uniref:ATP-binding cassette domain-containing protein n=1 Tax=Thermoflexus sp. TaxID=1969742 RepID=UPI0017591531|nr:ATP-binding cassette domain-containing protein [Thermoflexus sp.]